MTDQTSAPAPAPTPASDPDPAPTSASSGPSPARIALITGANKGIGFETARQLGRLGFTVLLGARDEERGRSAEESLRGEGIDARAVRLDVTDENSVRAAEQWVSARFDHLDALVNNAGVPSVGGQRAAPSVTSIQDMRSVYEINVFGVVRVTNAFLPLLRRAPAARIVNVSSEIGSMDATVNPGSPVSGTPASIQYPSSKAAVNMMTVQYAKELRDTPIKVNAANPGFTDTDFTQHRGIRPVEQGAEPSVHLATLPEDGPSGVLWGHVWTTEGDGDGGYGILPW
ncbi:SDR family oxidoreductase [Brachybacterium subflavum]|uniref:SDR family oxidoreductase n=1 Tax=Brachybacterium subflavum TaxID=2585206 RepID=UPI00126610AA|nr:SDR family oxidoreductase [Brachybacterium subflavum]